MVISSGAVCFIDGVNEICAFAKVARRMAKNVSKDFFMIRLLLWLLFCFSDAERRTHCLPCLCYIYINNKITKKGTQISRKLQFIKITICCLTHRAVTRQISHAPQGLSLICSFRNPKAKKRKAADMSWMKKCQPLPCVNVNLVLS